MKKLFLSLIALAVATVSFAQSTLLATLSHDGTISTFYGTTAFKDALEKADNGDAITLSAGQFLATNITKTITLRGAGMNMRNDSINSHESTIIQGAFEVNLTDSIDGRLVVEGVYFASNLTVKGSVRNAVFMKSRFQTITASGGTLVNSTFIHCRVANGFTLSSNSNACLVNSVVWDPKNKDTTNSMFEFDNCVVTFINSSYTANVINSYYKNCIIMAKCPYAGSGSYTSHLSYCIPSSCVAVNCIGCSDYGKISSVENNIFHYMSSKNSTNNNIDKPSSALKTGGFNYTDNEMFELTDAAKTQYLGADGKEVGIYGGNLPYEEDPTTPQITKCNVAAKSTADGKLSVDIEVKAAE